MNMIPEITSPEIIAAREKMNHAVRAVETATPGELETARDAYRIARTAYRETVDAAITSLHAN